MAESSYSSSRTLSSLFLILISMISFVVVSAHPSALQQYFLGFEISEDLALSLQLTLDSTLFLNNCVDLPSLSNYMQVLWRAGNEQLSTDG